MHEHQDTRPIQAVLDPYNPEGSTRQVEFTTSKQTRWKTDPELCHVNWAVCDSGWEAEFCRFVEAHPRVRAYVKNHNLGLEIPYRYGSTTRRHWPDFIVLVDDNQAENDPLHLLIEIKGYRREDAKIKEGDNRDLLDRSSQPSQNLRPLEVQRVHVRDGKIFVVRIGDELIVKRLINDPEAGWLLFSDNPEQGRMADAVAAGRRGGRRRGPMGLV